MHACTRVTAMHPYKIAHRETSQPRICGVPKSAFPHPGRSVHVCAFVPCLISPCMHVEIHVPAEMCNWTCMGPTTSLRSASPPHLPPRQLIEWKHTHVCVRASLHTLTPIPPHIHHILSHPPCHFPPSTPSADALSLPFLLLLLLLPCPRPSLRRRHQRRQV